MALLIHAPCTPCVGETLQSITYKLLHSHLTPLELGYLVSCQDALD